MVAVQAIPLMVRDELSPLVLESVLARRRVTDAEEGGANLLRIITLLAERQRELAH